MKGYWKSVGFGFASNRWFKASSLANDRSVASLSRLYLAKRGSTWKRRQRAWPEGLASFKWRFELKLGKSHEYLFGDINNKGFIQQQQPMITSLIQAFGCSFASSFSSSFASGFSSSSLRHSHVQINHMGQHQKFHGIRWFFLADVYHTIHNDLTF